MSLKDLDNLFAEAYDEVQQFDKLPDGEYDVQLIELIDGTVKKTDHKMWTLVFKVIDSDILVDKSLVNRREYFYIRLENVPEKIKSTVFISARKLKDLGYKNVGSEWSLNSIFNDLINKAKINEKYRLEIKTSDKTDKNGNHWRNVKVISFDILMQSILSE